MSCACFGQKYSTIHTINDTHRTNLFKRVHLLKSVKGRIQSGWFLRIITYTANGLG